MNYKSFVFALFFVLASTSCVYAQNKGKQVGKAVEAAVSKKVPAGAAAKAAKMPKGISAPAVKTPAAPRVPVGTKATTAAPRANAAKLPPPVSAAELMKGMRPASTATQAVAVPTQASQAVPQFERIRGYGDNIIGLRQVIEEFATANKRNAHSDLRDISHAFYDTDRRVTESIAEGKYVDPASYPDVWLKTSRTLEPKQSLKRYTASDSPLQPIFKLREQQLQDASNPNAVANPVELRFVLLDETTTRTAQEIEALVENMNVYDPLRSQIQEALGSAQKETGEGVSSSTFLDISHQLPRLEEEIAEFSSSRGRDVWTDIQRIREGFAVADRHVFLKQGNKIKARDPYDKTSYEEIWKNRHPFGRGRLYESAESPLQQIFDLRQKQLDYLRSQEGNFLVDPSVGNKATMRVAQEIQGKLSNLPETNPLRTRLEMEINWSQFLIEP